jgi:hypothetical protein
MFIGIDVAKIPSLQEQPVQSAITVPTPECKVPLNESLTVMGYAYSGGGRGPWLFLNNDINDNS